MKNPETLLTWGEVQRRFALTREETAKGLGIGASTLDKLASRGLIRPSRATRRPLYSVREIERFLRDTTAQIDPEADGIAGA